jgi:uncharacterized protein YlxP (DUF503 family)
MVHACILVVELRLPESRSLKAKRRTVKHLVEGARSRFGVAAAETGHQDTWQRSQLAFAQVSGSVAQCEAVLDSVERFVWSEPDAEVLSSERRWLDPDADADAGDGTGPAAPDPVADPGADADPGPDSGPDPSHDSGPDPAGPRDADGSNVG